ncbi:hypothetical protein D9613_010583 [Agrocybe pediades]|uniref:Uncharacterized protein n=1 Tax=Agrocybe pediades TaxID=84607 RepID=A0A8H4QF20_9AGAR|nr:hypothetical protein D9613_010583 [Agrocybe pediades]
MDSSPSEQWMPRDNSVQPGHEPPSQVTVSRGLCATFHHFLAEILRKALPCLTVKDDADDGMALQTPASTPSVVTARVVMAVVGPEDVRTPFSFMEDVELPGDYVVPSPYSGIQSPSAGPLGSSPEIRSVVDPHPQSDAHVLPVDSNGTPNAIAYSPEELKAMVSRPSSLDILASLDTVVVPSQADPFNAALGAIAASCWGTTSLPLTTTNLLNHSDTAINPSASQITAFGSNPVLSQMSIDEFNEQQEKIQQYRRLGGRAATMIMYLENRRQRQREANNNTILGVLNALSSLKDNARQTLLSEFWPADAEDEKLDATWMDRRPFYFCPPPSPVSSPAASEVARMDLQYEEDLHCFACSNVCAVCRLRCGCACPACVLEEDALVQDVRPFGCEENCVHDFKGNMELGIGCYASTGKPTATDNKTGIAGAKDRMEKKKVLNRQLNIYDLTVYLPHGNSPGLPDNIQASNKDEKGGDKPDRRRKKKNRATTLEFSKEEVFKAYLTSTKTVAKDGLKVHKWLANQIKSNRALSDKDEIRTWLKMSRHKSTPNLCAKSDRKEEFGLRRIASVIGNVSTPDPFLQSLAPEYAMRDFSNFMSLSPTIPVSSTLQGPFDPAANSCELSASEKHLDVPSVSGPCEPCSPLATSSDLTTRKLPSSPPASMLEPAPRKPLRAKRLRGTYISEIVSIKDTENLEPESVPEQPKPMSSVPAPTLETISRRTSACSGL